MPSKLDPHVALIERWFAAEPNLTAIAIVARLAERHPEQFGNKQHSIVQRLLRALRQTSAQRLIAEGCETPTQPPGAVDGSGYGGPNPPTAPPLFQPSRLINQQTDKHRLGNILR